VHASIIHTHVGFTVNGKPIEIVEELIVVTKHDKDEPAVMRNLDRFLARDMQYL
jgi:hypothetical protein